MATGQPWIGGEVQTFRSGGDVPGLGKASENTNVYIYVGDQSGTVPIRTATVSINGVALVYDREYEEYSGKLSLDPGDPVAIEVTLAGVAYTAAGQHASSYPILLAPANGARWSVLAQNVISWTGTVVQPDESYGMTILKPDGSPDWPSKGGLFLASRNQRSQVLSQGSFSVGERFAVLGVMKSMPVAGAVPGSYVRLGAFDYTQFKAAEHSDVLSSIETSPPYATLGIGETQQITATGTFDDESTGNITGEVTWSSSDPSRVSVSDTGLVTALALGGATIVAEKGLVSGATLATVFEPTPLPALPSSQATSYRIDHANTGRVTTGAGGPVLPPVDQWSTRLNGRVSYPLVAGGKVFVTTYDAGVPLASGGSLYALELATGEIAWGPVDIAGRYAFTGHAYEAGRLFVVNSDAVLSSFDASSGGLLWTRKLVKSTRTASPPTAAGGIVYQVAVEYGAAIYAVDQRSGNLMWYAPVSGNYAAPAVSNDGVFVSLACQAYGFGAVSGATLWHYAGPCTGGGSTAVLAGNRMLAERIEPGLPYRVTAIDTATGALVGNFPGTTVPAAGSDLAYVVDGRTLNALRLEGLGVDWSVELESDMVTAPLIIDDVVVVGAESGSILVVDAATGSVRWSGAAGAPILRFSEGGGVNPNIDLGAGEGYLVVPADDLVTAWRIVP